MKNNFPEEFRYVSDIFPYDARSGVFVIPHKMINDYFYQCIVSRDMGWEHVSVSLAKKKHRVERCPTWVEMCFIKDVFWDEEERVVQYHPPKSEYISMHPYCLHLWRPTNQEIPFPPSIMVGI